MGFSPTTDEEGVFDIGGFARGGFGPDTGIPRPRADIHEQRATADRSRSVNKDSYR